jgi:signal peptidase I
VFRVLSVIGLVCALLVAGLMLVPTILGYQRYVLVSGSMTPAIPTGSIVYDEVVPVSELAVGDVITFVPPPSYGITTPVTHRISRSRRTRRASGRSVPRATRTTRRMRGR